jgi:hypothetical protein
MFRPFDKLMAQHERLNFQRLRLIPFALSLSKGERNKPEGTHSVPYTVDLAMNEIHCFDSGKLWRLSP